MTATLVINIDQRQACTVSADVINDIVEMFQQGYNTQAIARITDTAHVTVVALIDKYGDA